MMRSVYWASLAAVVKSALADTHYLYSGFFSGSTIVAVEFDSDTNSLSVVNNITADISGSKWILLDAQKKNLYVGTTGYFNSYALTEDWDLSYQSNVTLSSDCDNANFIAASTKNPYAVFVTPYSTGCSTLAVSVNESGALDTTFANATYNSTSGVHGTALSPEEDFLYSADDMGNAVWVHSYDAESGSVELVQYLAAAEGADPRHLTVHPNGKWVYVVYEAANSIASYRRDTDTGKLTFVNTTYSLLPSGYTNTSSYWADEVLFSQPTSAEAKTSPKYLIAATRSRSTDIPGHVSAFELDPETGAIVEQLFLLPTTGSGGSANAVTPALFSEDYFAITDSGDNFLEVWKIESGSEATTASAVAHLDLESGPANAVWYS